MKPHVKWAGLLLLTGRTAATIGGATAVGGRINSEFSTWSGQVYNATGPGVLCQKPEMGVPAVYSWKIHKVLKSFKKHLSGDPLTKGKWWRSRTDDRNGIQIYPGIQFDVVNQSGNQFLPDLSGIDCRGDRVFHSLFVEPANPINNHAALSVKKTTKDMMNEPWWFHHTTDVSLLINKPYLNPTMSENQYTFPYDFWNAESIWISQGRNISVSQALMMESFVVHRVHNLRITLTRNLDLADIILNRFEDTFSKLLSYRESSPVMNRILPLKARTDVVWGEATKS